MALILTPLTHIPLINPGDDLATLILKSVAIQGITLQTGDIFSITQKIISKSENQFACLKDFEPTPEAFQYAQITGKDPRLIQMILSESKSVIRAKLGTIIVEHRLGFICANAGIDQSNVSNKRDCPDEIFLLLPRNPEGTAKAIRIKINEQKNIKIGVLVIDSHGRPWRHGVVGIAIGTSGVPALVDLRGKDDLFKRKLKITQVAAVDELAAASSLVMGQAAENIPVIHIRGFPYDLRESSLSELIREKESDLFR